MAKHATIKHDNPEKYYELQDQLGEGYTLQPPRVSLARSLALSHTPRVCVCVRSRGGVSSSYGSVWRAIKKGTNEEVAIKRVPLDDDVDDLHKEMDVMKECNSPYVVKYHGCYLKGSEELWVRRRERQRARECRLAPLPLLLYILVALDPTACRCFVESFACPSSISSLLACCWRSVSEREFSR